jgi:4-hydroxymandelate oxidase
VSLSDARAIFCRRARYDFFAGGAGAEETVASNLSAWRELELRPHVLRDVSVVDLSVEVLGTRLRAPLMVAPMATHRLAHPDGELATARAVAAPATCL